MSISGDYNWNKKSKTRFGLLHTMPAWYGELIQEPPQAPLLSSGQQLVALAGAVC